LTSFPNQNGVETLIYHLYDPTGLETNIKQTIIVIPMKLPIAASCGVSSID